MEVYEEKAFTAIYPKKPVGKPKFVNKSLQKDWSFFVLFFLTKLEFKGKNLAP